MAYIEALVGTAPYYKTKTTDSRNKLDALFTKASNDLNKMYDLRIDQYVLRKLRAWYAQFPLTPRVVCCTDDPEEGQIGALEDGGKDEAEDASDKSPYAFSDAE